jgi:phenylalanyl-tRNA synthetase beta chain
MRLLVSWLRDFVDVPASADEIADGLGLRGFEVAAIEPFGNGDAVIDFEVTPNRPDCLSVVGLAREAATLFDRPVTLPSTGADAKIRLNPTLSGKSDQLSVAIADEALCPRYAAAVAEVTIARSPSWIAARLQGAGIRPINTVVDITNYVLIELGHPTHAFDLKKLAGAQIHVRRANRDETITTLDGIDRKLDTDMLVIADRDRAQAVAGVMGGALAEVSDATTLVALESAYFKPASVRRTSKTLGLKTEASSRFERGADINAPVVALQRIGALLEQVGSGRLRGPIVDVYPSVREPLQLHMRRNRLAMLLGAAVPDSQVERILRNLGLTVTAVADGWNVVAPTFRVDLLREVDLIEEVGRHYGFDKLPATFPVVTTPAAPPDPRIPRDRLVRRVLTAAGLSEAVTFGFIEAKSAEAFKAAGADRAVGVENPLSGKFDTLRPSLIPGVVDAVAHNRRHGKDDVGLFEIGTRFSIRGETRAVAIAWTGTTPPAHWSGGSHPVDFFDLKGVIERLCGALGVTPRLDSTKEPFLVPGRAASIATNDGRELGLIGLLSPSVAEARDLPRDGDVFVAELNLDLMDGSLSKVAEAVAPLPRHPLVTRDLSIVVSDVLPAEIIRGTIQTAAAQALAPLVDITFFDRYQGKGIPDGSISLSLRLKFQAPDRTLTDSEVQRSVETIVAALVRTHGAIQR